MNDTIQPKLFRHIACNRKSWDSVHQKPKEPHCKTTFEEEDGALGKYKADDYERYLYDRAVCVCSSPHLGEIPPLQG